MPGILLDTCVWAGALEALETAGHDVVWAGDWANDPGDAAILDYAYKERRILVTLDKDFGELAILKGQPHCGMIRLLGFSVRELSRVILQVVDKHECDLANGGIIVATPKRLRIRPPE